MLNLSLSYLLWPTVWLRLSTEQRTPPDTMVDFVFRLCLILQWKNSRWSSPPPPPYQHHLHQQDFHPIIFLTMPCLLQMCLLLPIIISLSSFSSVPYMIDTWNCIAPTSHHSHHNHHNHQLYPELRNVNSFTRSKILELNFTQRKACK